MPSRFAIYHPSGQTAIKTDMFGKDVANLVQFPRSSVAPSSGIAATLPLSYWEWSPAMDDKTRTELEAAVYRRLVEHLRQRTDVQNIDLMNLAGFCRNCLSNWMKDAADERGLAMSKDESRAVVYGMPYDEWRAKYQKEATPEQQAAFAKAAHKH
jgi:hypothetical protein